MILLVIVNLYFLKCLIFLWFVGKPVEVDSCETFCSSSTSLTMLLPSPWKNGANVCFLTAVSFTEVSLETYFRSRFRIRCQWKQEQELHIDRVSSKWEKRFMRLHLEDMVLRIVTGYPMSKTNLFLDKMLSINCITGRCLSYQHSVSRLQTCRETKFKRKKLSLSGYYFGIFNYIRILYFLILVHDLVQSELLAHTPPPFLSHHFS